MMNVCNERMLIISNNVLSNTRNNGKTIYSYIDSLPPQNVAQLYFNREYPSINGYKYFRITDMDIVKGILFPNKRGRIVNDVVAGPTKNIAVASKYKGETFRFIRELLWVGKWKSKSLIRWLDDYAPTAIFFVGGDCLFAYDICKFIAKRYNAKTSLYITDDYIMSRKNDSFIGKIRKYKIKKKIKNCLEYAQSFFTVSELMRKAYRKVFGKDSLVIVNLSDPLKISVKKKNNDVYTIMYAGSLYYGRDEVLGKLSHSICEFNDTFEKKAILKVYTNSIPDENKMKNFIIDGASEYCGSLDKEGLKQELNRADILLFVESFDEDFVEKTMYSLSTKIPEYLSVGKPILAIGPAGIGSMEYLSDVAVCVNDISELKCKLEDLLNSEALQAEVANRCEDKYFENHSKDKMQQKFITAVLG